jgi:hypothetical protein
MCNARITSDGIFQDCLNTDDDFDVIDILIVKTLLVFKFSIKLSRGTAMINPEAPV